MDIRNLIRQEILGQEGYTIENPCRIKMDAMENPFTLPSSLRDELFGQMNKVALNRYPAPGAPLVRQKFARYFDVEPERVMVGNGSDELIQILCTALAFSDPSIMIPVPTFAMYRIIALNAGHKVMEVPLDQAFDLDTDAMLEKISGNAPALLFISYPNNPTGNCFSEGRIEALIAGSRGIVVVDEAYSIFSGKSLMPLLEKYDNLVILKTLSKAGLAAMRIGFMLGSVPLIRELDKVRLPYNVNSLSQVAATFFIEQSKVFLDQAAEVVRERSILYGALQKMPGITPYPSEANFILFKCDSDTDQAFGKLVKQGVLIKNMGSSGILKNCMRVTVGSPAENKEFLDALKNATP
jgi:histidinol-phosphate aminotransferase